MRALGVAAIALLMASARAGHPHPLVWLGMATLGGPPLVRLAGLELWTTTVEAILYARLLHLPRAEALGLSTTANAASLLGVAALAAAFT